jgi:8-oxo-dGTP pyrophosphatase MutT (NUDIX family)
MYPSLKNNMMMTNTKSYRYRRAYRQSSHVNRKVVQKQDSFNNQRFFQTCTSQHFQKNKTNLFKTPTNNSPENNICECAKAGCVIFDLEKNHIVVVKNRMSFEKNENKYGLPKGSFDASKDKSSHEAAAREVYEETGLNVYISENCKFIKIFDIIYYIILLDKRKHPIFSPTDNVEILGAEWMHVKDLKQLNLNRSLSKLVRVWYNTPVHI